MSENRSGLGAAVPGGSWLLVRDGRHMLDRDQGHVVGQRPADMCQQVVADVAKDASGPDAVRKATRSARG